MKYIKLVAGHNPPLPIIREPTHILSTAERPWDAIIEPASSDQPALNVQAPVIVQGCTIRGGTYGIKGHSDIPVPIVVDNCWIENNLTSGIMTSSFLFVSGCLIEYNGSSRQYDHGIYADGATIIRNSIIWCNSGGQIHHAKPDTTIAVQQCLIGGERSLIIYHKFKPEVRIKRCTVQGEIMFGGETDITELDRTNIIVEEADAERGRWWCVHSNRRLFWLTDAVKEWAGRGCFDYVPGFNPPSNDNMIAYAKTLWTNGHMYAVDGHWSNHAGMQQPIFPGDVILSERGITAEVAGVAEEE